MLLSVQKLSDGLRATKIMSIIQSADDGIFLRVRVQPRASAERVEGVQGDYLRMRLTASPVDGAANKACVAQRAGQRAAHPACTMGIYGGVASWSTDPRIKARAKTYQTLASLGSPVLEDDVLRALGRPVDKQP